MLNIVLFVYLNMDLNINRSNNSGNYNYHLMLHLRNKDCYNCHMKKHKRYLLLDYNLYRVQNISILNNHYLYIIFLILYHSHIHNKDKDIH